jgi:acyl-CoA thioesterase FadM
MNLFFRFLRIILPALLARPGTSLLDMHRLQFAVWLGDQDPMGHMTNSRYSSFTDLAIMNYMGRTGALMAFRRRGWLPVIQHEAFTYFRMLRFPERFEIQTRLIGWENTQMVFQHDFLREGRLHAQSLMIARLTGRRKMHVTAAMALEALGISLQSPPLGTRIRDVLDEINAERI